MRIEKKSSVLNYSVNCQNYNVIFQHDSIKTITVRFARAKKKIIIKKKNQTIRKY